MMKVIGMWALIFAFVMPGRSQEAPLRLVQTMPVPGGVEGRFDHFAVDLKGKRLFLAAPDHKTVEVFDLAAGKWIHSIGGFVTPHAIVYLPESNRIMLSDGGDDTPNGWCRILSGDTLELLDSLKIAVDADPIRYDPAAKILYMINGGKDDGKDYSLVSVIDTSAGKKLADIKVPGPELEAMAVEPSSRRLYVNIKTYNQVGIIDREKRELVSTWPITGGGVPTPMALDDANHRLFVGSRKPPAVVVFDTGTGKVVTSVPCVGDADDMFYDRARRRLYVTGEEGFVSLIRQASPDRYEPIAKIPTAPGARNSVFVPEWNQLFVAVPGKGEQKAAVLVFHVEP
jgi:hypothetical protein